MRRNPFKPTYGKTPPVVVGIDMLLEGFEQALDNVSGDPESTILLLDYRGAGKTVALTSLERIAQSRGWLVIRTESSSGMCKRIAAKAHNLLVDQTTGSDPDQRVEQSTIGTKGTNRQVTETFDAARPDSVHGSLEPLAAHLLDHDTGVFITIDEIQDVDPDEMRELGNAIQFLVRDDLPVAFAAAGLPSAIDLLEIPGTTFLTRASRHSIGRFVKPDVERAIAQPLKDRGVTIDEAGLDAAANATGGYAFMIQLVGYWAWQTANDGHITVADVEIGIRQAQARIGAAVVEPTWNRLSASDRSFLLAMAVDDGPTRVADLASRLSKDGNHVNAYRRRLIDQAMIEPVSQGVVGFVHEATRQWLREQQAFAAAPFTD